MTKVVIIDNHGQFTHLEGRAMRDLGVEHEIVESETPVDEVWELEPDAFVLSGGPSMEGAGNSAEYLTGDVPVLGICLGHQIIATELGGRVEPGDYGGFADVDVEITDDDGILEGLGDRLSVWASHGDEVVELPDGFVRTARSDICEIEAMRHESLPIYGVQWHPEVSHTEKGLELFENFVSVADGYS